MNSFQNVDATMTQYQQNNQLTESAEQQKRHTIRRERLKLKTDVVIKGKTAVFITALLFACHK